MSNSLQKVARRWRDVLWAATVMVSWPFAAVCWPAAAGAQAPIAYDPALPSQTAGPARHPGPWSDPPATSSPATRSHSPGLVPSGLLDQQGQEILLPPVCISDLPGLPAGDPSGSRPLATGQPDPTYSRSDRQAWEDQQWRDALRQVIEGPDPAQRPVARTGHFAGRQEPPAVSAQDGLGSHPHPHAHPHPLPAVGQDRPAGSWQDDVVRQMYNPHAKASADRAAWQRAPGHLRHGPGTVWEECDQLDPHAEVFAKTLFPSATECAPCHQQIFDQWASSSHAYAAISPMFHRFEDTINRLTHGTIGYFCMRCHAPVATTVGLRRDQPIWDGPRVFREGVTCIACHHVQEVTLKTNGERRIEPGTLADPVTGGSSGQGNEALLKYADHFKVKSDPEDQRTGQLMHRRVFQFQEISESTFCMSCHQVAVQPGIKLEVVWDQYRASPAYREGISCQDCHMGKVPGVAEGYALGPAAVVDGRVVDPLRKHSNHMFFGPGYSIAHPGIFPHDPAQDRWTVHQWLEFDWRAGWGTDHFEDQVARGLGPYHFPPTWQDVEDRYDAREIVDRNLNKLEYKRQIRRQVMENGSRIDGPFFDRTPQAGRDLSFHYCVQNISKGHNMPSGSLGAQPQLWLNVVLIAPDGQAIWESGYLDSQGDLADLHSTDVLNKRLPLDRQLFNLQTKFLTSNVKGTDREMYLPINVDIDQLPFIRPAPQPVSVINHPPFIRMEAHSIPATGQRKARYTVPGHLLNQPGTYRLSVRMRSRAEPIYFMKFVQASPEMIRSMNEWIVDVHPATVVFEVR